MKKLLITGGTGFIGRNLCEQLADKYDIIAPTSRDLDLLDEEALSRFLEKAGFDVIIHTATWNATRTSDKNLSKVLENNLRMFLNLTRCEGEYGKMIYYGSGAEFGREHWHPMMREEDILRHVPKDAYGFSKYIMAQYTLGHPHIYNLRLFGVYGKYEDWRIRFISNACARCVHDLPITIRQNACFDYLHVDDLVRVTRWFIENTPAQKTVNVCTGKTNELLTLAELVRKVSGKNLDILISQDGMGREYSGDNSRMLTQTGGITFKDVEAGIADLYRWYEENKSNLNRDVLLAEAEYDKVDINKT